MSIYRGHRLVRSTKGHHYSLVRTRNADGVLTWDPGRQRSPVQLREDATNLDELAARLIVIAEQVENGTLVLGDQVGWKAQSRRLRVAAEQFGVVADGNRAVALALEELEEEWRGRPRAR